MAKRLIVKTLVLLVVVFVLLVMVFWSVVPNASHLNASEISDRPVRITADVIPDASFKAYVEKNFDTDGNGYLSQSERNAVTTIGSYDSSTFAVTDAGVSGLNISSLEGIELFPNIKSLVAAENNITNLDISGNKELLFIDMRGNPSFVLYRATSNNNVQLLVDDNMASSGNLEGVDIRDA